MRRLALVPLAALLALAPGAAERVADDQLAFAAHSGAARATPLAPDAMPQPAGELDRGGTTPWIPGAGLVALAGLGTAAALRRRRRRGR